MTAEELRATQAPLKARYQEDPAAAGVTMRASATVLQGAVQCRVDTGKPGVPAGLVSPSAPLRSGLHPAAGGDGTAACSADIMLEALAGCAGVTLAAVATAMGITLRSATVTAEGDMDFRGTLGVSKDAPVGFTHVRLAFAIDSDAPAEKLEKLVQLAERYWPAL